jgi:methionine synthase II (cobalamin-independent)
MTKTQPTSGAEFPIGCTLSGVHSRSEETVRVSRDFDRGRTSKQDLEKTFEKDSTELVKLEQACGFTDISDGQITWQDFLRPFSDSIIGLKSGADMSRWFDTNSFYRKPTVVKELKFPKETSAFNSLEVKKAFTPLKTSGDRRENSPRKKIALPGPYTLSSLVEDQFYNSKKDLLFDFARMTKKLLKLLAEKGFQSVQIDEPSLVYRYGESALTNRKHLKWFLSAFEEHLSSPPVDIFLHTYFGDCSSILDDLIDLEGPSGIGVDFTQTSLDSTDEVKFGEKLLGCGCIDGRNSLIESPEWVADFSTDAIKTLKPSGLILLPSCELKYLPRKYADEKVKSIGSARDVLRRRKIGE